MSPPPAAFTLFFVVLGRIGPTRTAIVMAMEAVIGIVLSAIFLDEAVKPIVAVGGTAILRGCRSSPPSRNPR